jgi:hypothetical protein
MENFANIKSLQSLNEEEVAVHTHSNKNFDIFQLLNSDNTSHNLTKVNSNRRIRINEKSPSQLNFKRKMLVQK